MKLIKLTVSRAFGYLPIDVSFNSDVSILVGPNGSGKTTALRLVHAILTPSFDELYAIPFDSASISYEDGGEVRRIDVKRTEQFVSLKVDHIPDQLTLPAISFSQLEALRGSPTRSESVTEIIRGAFIGSPVFEYLRKLNSPLFLGLDRRHLQTNWEGASASDREYLPNRVYHQQGERPNKGSLVRSLFDVQELAQEAYRRFRRSQETMTASLRRAVLLSAFRYTEFSFEKALPNESMVVLERRAEIAQAIENLGIEGDDIRKQLDDFFDRLALLFKQIKSRGQEQELNIELLTNRAQIERIEDLIGLIEKFRSDTDRSYEPIAKFVGAINDFFSDSGKEIVVDQVGTLWVVRPDKQRVGVDALSSGERQLLIIFGHLFFNRYAKRSNVFIIDEPELSLHLRWQENFLSCAIGANQSAQFILATHSPEIVGRYREKCIRLGGALSYGA